MNRRNMPSGPRIAVLLCSGLVFTVWLAVHLWDLTATQNGTIRFFLSLLLGLVIVLRPKPNNPTRPMPLWVVVAAAAIGTFGVVAGLVAGIAQFQWLGILLLLFGGLGWALPDRFTKDLALGLFLVYWAHPLPHQAFAPLQFWAQKLSVAGSEWLLHALNVRVWASGFVLHTGVTTYEVPAWCSGMRTVTTVFLLGIGLSILKRLRWHEGVGVVLLAVAQGLILNMFRIVTMVVSAPRFGPGRDAAFLHDTAGIIVIGAVLLVYVELHLWEAIRRRAKERGADLNPEQMKTLTGHPRSWHVLVQHWGLLAALAGLIVVIAGAINRNRPRHRYQMVREVAIAMQEAGHLEKALEAALWIKQYRPDDTEWQLSIARILLQLGRYDGVLAELASIPDATPGLTTQKGILRAYSLMGQGRLEDAAAIVETLPEYVRRKDPRVAMILAEMAVRRGAPEEAADAVVVASRWTPNTARVRRLYPYLRVHRKWAEIRDSEVRRPYTRPEQALSAAEAHMNLDHTPDVARIALEATEKWPTDLRVLEPLFFMAIKRGDAEWEHRFSEHLVRSVRETRELDALYPLFEKCFGLGRPDLAWTVFSRIHGTDPEHPALAMAVAQYGAAWFSFRRRSLGLTSTQAAARIDLRTFFMLGLNSKYWRTTCARVPLGAELCGPNVTSTRKRFLAAAIDTFKLRDEEGTLSRAMEYEYVRALEIADLLPAARAMLDRVARVHPEERQSVSLLLAEIYARKGHWHEVYEILRAYLDVERPTLGPILLLCQAQLNLHMGLAAVFTAREAVRLFPNSAHAALLLASTLLQYDSAEEALLALSRPRARHLQALDLAEAEALHRTQRFTELTEFQSAALLQHFDVSPDTPQRLSLPPAEYALLWHRIHTLSDAEMGQVAQGMRKNLTQTSSPFLAATIRQWLACYDAGAVGEAADVEAWLRHGRHRIERASALNHLTLLLCWQGRLLDARNVASKAVKFFPESAQLWRILISLSGAHPQVIEAARKSCPDDSDIWLASLVFDVDQGGVPEHELVRKLHDIVDSGRDGRAPYTTAAMVRAGDFLLRRDMPTAATIAARDATQRARGLLPAHVLGIRAAIMMGDRDAARRCTEAAIKCALRPPPALYEKLVSIKAADTPIATDLGMVNALRELRKEDPDNLLWPQMLGFVRFKRGGWDVSDALYQMTVAVDGGATNKTPYLIAAEAARRRGLPNRAVSLLRSGLALHPDDPAMLNNLAFALCFTEEGVEEALSLIPTLRERAGDDPSVRDTIAEVLFRAGRLDEASQTLSNQLARVGEGTTHRFRTRVLRARIAMARHDTDEARAVLSDALRHSMDVAEDDVLEANRLLAGIESDALAAELAARAKSGASNGPAHDARR